MSSPMQVPALVQRTPGVPADDGSAAIARFEIITVAYRSREPLAQMLAHLPASVRVTIVDNSSDAEDLTDLVQSRPNTNYVNSGANIGFGAACNLGVAHTTAPIVVFVNPDTVLQLELLTMLVGVVEQDPRCAATGAATVDAAGRPIRGGGGWEPTVIRCIAHGIGFDWLKPHSGIWLRHRPKGLLRVEWLAGTCLAVRRVAFEEVGGFDSRYFLYQEDMDLGRRLRARGHRLILCGSAAVVHEGGQSSPGVLKPSLWRQRASALTEYLMSHNRRCYALAMRWTLAAGFLLRSLVYGLGGRAAQRREMLIYAKTLLLHSSCTSRQSAAMRTFP